VTDCTVTTTGSERLTGISDTVFNLGSVFYYAAEGGQVYAKYIEDAEREGDTEIVEFFREVQEQDAKRAQKAKALLSRKQSK
jgi:rubrerythrin